MGAINVDEFLKKAGVKLDMRVVNEQDASGLVLVRFSKRNIDALAELLYGEEPNANKTTLIGKRAIVVHKDALADLILRAANVDTTFTVVKMETLFPVWEG